MLPTNCRRRMELASSSPVEKIEHTLSLIVVSTILLSLKPTQDRMSEVYLAWVK